VGPNQTAETIGWNVVTGADARAAANFGRDAHWDAERRYDRAEEFITVTQQLWDSWEDGALLRDRTSGIFVDAAKVHPVGFRGEHFSVAGPLNVARPPQGHPPLVQAGTSDRARELGARQADVIFTAQTDAQEARAFRSDIHDRARGFGRDPHQIAVLPGLVPVVGSSLSEAHRLYDRLNALVVDHGDLQPLWRELGADLSAFALDEPVAHELFSDGGRAYCNLAAAAIGREVSTPRALRDFFTASGRGHRLVVGDPTRISDLIEEWLSSGAADGFNICPPYLPGGLDLSVDLVVPELQTRLNGSARTVVFPVRAAPRLLGRADYAPVVDDGEWRGAECGAR
jgi:alkanesulfonate monooxygenase